MQSITSPSPSHNTPRAPSPGQMCPNPFPSDFPADHLTSWLSPAGARDSVLDLGYPSTPPSFGRLLLILYISSQMHHYLGSFPHFPEVCWSFSSHFQYHFASEDLSARLCIFARLCLSSDSVFLGHRLIF